MGIEKCFVRFKFSIASYIRSGRTKIGVLSRQNLLSLRSNAQHAALFSSTVPAWAQLRLEMLDEFRIFEGSGNASHASPPSSKSSRSLSTKLRSRT